MSKQPDPALDGRLFGSEDEVLVIDRNSLVPKNNGFAAAELMKGRDPKTIVKPELNASMVEAVSPPYAAGDTGDIIVRSRFALLETAQTVGAVPIHYPSSLSTAPGGNEISDDDRYRKFEEDAQDVIQQPVTGVHVHMQVSDENERVETGEILAAVSHIFTALSGSPFVNGVNTGYAGSRTKLFTALPTFYDPEVHGTMSGWKAEARLVLLDSKHLPDPENPDYTYVHPLVRPSTKNQPTIEGRMTDSQVFPEYTYFTRHLLQAMMTTAYMLVANGEPSPFHMRLGNALRAPRIHASRYGMSKDLRNPFKESRHSGEGYEPAWEVMHQLFEYAKVGFEALDPSGKIYDNCAKIMAFMEVKGTSATILRDVHKRLHFAHYRTGDAESHYARFLRGEPMPQQIQAQLSAAIVFANHFVYFTPENQAADRASLIALGEERSRVDRENGVRQRVNPLDLYELMGKQLYRGNKAAIQTAFGLEVEPNLSFLQPGPAPSMAPAGQYFG